MPTVRVDQKEGPITISVDGGDPVTRNVNDHLVTVAEKDLDLFVSLTGGTVTEAKPASKEK